MATISTHNLARAIYESTKGKHGADLDMTLKNSVELIWKKSLLSKSKDILAQLERIVDDDTGTIHAKVTSSKKLSSAHVNEVEEFLKKHYKVKEVIITFEEEKSLLDGIKIETRDDKLDLTLSGKVKQLQEYLLQN